MKKKRFTIKKKYGITKLILSSSWFKSELIDFNDPFDELLTIFSTDALIDVKRI